MTDHRTTIEKSLHTSLGTTIAEPPLPGASFVESSLSIANNRRARQRRWIIRILAGATLFGAGLLVGLRGRRPSTPVGGDDSDVPTVPDATNTVGFLDALPTLVGDVAPLLLPVFVVLGIAWLAIAQWRRSRIARPLPGAALLALAVASIGVGVLIAVRLAIGVYFIPSGSMEPSLSVDNRVVVARYDTDVEIGDVIIFRDRTAATANLDRIKRVVALAGDTVTVTRGQLLVNGRPSIALPIDPDHPIQRATPDDLFSVVVGQGEVFVMGDNYNNSRDSRHTGAIKQSDVVATVRWSTGGNLRLVETEPDR